MSKGQSKARGSRSRNSHCPLSFHFEQLSYQGALSPAPRIIQRFSSSEAQHVQSQTHPCCHINNKDTQKPFSKFLCHRFCVVSLPPGASSFLEASRGIKESKTGSPYYPLSRHRPARLPLPTHKPSYSPGCHSGAKIHFVSVRTALPSLAPHTM